MAGSLELDSHYMELKKIRELESFKLQRLKAANEKVSSVNIFEDEENLQNELNQAKLFRLMAEKRVVERTLPRTVPINTPLLLSSAKQKLKTEINDMTSLRNNLQREKEFLIKKQETINLSLKAEREHSAAVKEKCITNDIDPDDQSAENDKTIVITDTADNPQEMLKKFQKVRNLKFTQLRRFFNKYFPIPSQALYEQMADSDIFIEHKSNSQPMKSLDHIVHLLIAAHMKNSQESWILLDPTFWPPYVELVLRYGIAVRHQENPLLLKLKTFGQSQ